MFRGQMMLFHIWLQIMFMKEECAAMSEKEIRGAVIGVTDDGYPIVTEDYSCTVFYRDQPEHARCAGVLVLQVCRLP